MGEHEASNVLFVVLDTVRKDRLSPYGHTHEEHEITPTLSRFAAEATTFDSAIAPAPWTVPVHASMFTGRYPSEHGATQGSPYLDGVQTLATTLSAAGYETACFSANAWITPYTGLTAGFDEHDSFFEVLPRDLFSGPAASAWQRLTDSDRLRDIASRIVRLGAAAHDRLASGDRADSKTPAVIDRTREFIEASEGDWFAFVNLMDAHLPYYPPESQRKRFAPDVDPDAVCQDSKAYNAGAQTISEGEWQDIRALYDAEIAHIDAELGRLFEWLRDTDRWADTTVIVCADHGELHGEHGLYGHEFALYEELINVPLLVKHPSLTADRQTGVVELLDLYHTVLDALDVDPLAYNVHQEDDGGDDAQSVDIRRFDPSRSLLSSTGGERAETPTDMAETPTDMVETPADIGQRARAGVDTEAEFAFVEYARPEIELHHLETKAAAAGIDLPSDHRGYARMQAARGPEAKFIRADVRPDEGYRLTEDPAEQTPVEPTDGPVAEARDALASFARETGDPWTDAVAEDVDADVLDDADDALKNRLQDLGYLG